MRRYESKDRLVHTVTAPSCTATTAVHRRPQSVLRHPETTRKLPLASRGQDRTLRSDTETERRPMTTLPRRRERGRASGAAARSHQKESDPGSLGRETKSATENGSGWIWHEADERQCVPPRDGAPRASACRLGCPAARPPPPTARGAPTATVTRRRPLPGPARLGAALRRGRSRFATTRTRRFRGQYIYASRPSTEVAVHGSRLKFRRTRRRLDPRRPHAVVLPGPEVTILGF